MSAENFANGYTTVLQGAITAGATSLVVASASGAPSVPFKLSIDAEIVKVTAVAGTTYTVTRAQEGTTAAAHADGATVENLITAEPLNLGLVMAGTAFPASPATGDRFFRTDRNITYVWDGTRWLSHVIEMSFLAAVPPTASGQWNVDSVMARAAQWSATQEIFITDVGVSSHVSGTNGAGNYWSWRFRGVTPPYGATTIHTFTTVNDGNAVTRHSASLNVILDVAAHPMLDVFIFKTGAPGVVLGAPSLKYRLVG
jgi:hypothetical protein